MFGSLNKLAALMLYAHPLQIRVSVVEDGKPRPSIVLQREKGSYPLYRGSPVDTIETALFEVLCVLRRSIEIGRQTNLEEHPYIDLRVEGPRLSERNLWPILRKKANTQELPEKEV